LYGDTVQLEFRLCGEVSQLRRFASLAVLLFFTIPFGLSVVGCGHKAAATVYCNGGDTGPTAGELNSIVLSPNLAIQGESLNYGQIGSGLSASGLDCKGATVSVRSYVYATTNMSFADVNPTSGQACGGTWNRNTGGGVPDYTTCIPPTAAALQGTNGTTNFLAYLTATAGGVVSNAVPVYVHPVVTSIVFGKSTVGGCSANGGTAADPDTTCCPASPTTVLTGIATYDGVSCVSQNGLAQVAARIYANNSTSPANNITCQSGHLSFGTQGAGGIVSLDQNGVATADQPGSVALTAALSNSTSANSIGFFSTCPPAKIVLTPVGQAGLTSINVPINNTQPLTAAVTDTNGQSITISGGLEFESTTPQTIVANGGSVVPVFPGTATITAVCQPPACNPAPLSQIGVNGNGKPTTSNGIQVTATGTSSTVLYVGSTASQYLYTEDFTTGLPGSLAKLPYIPNSMVISQDGSTIYLGSPEGLMTFSTAANSLSAANQTIQGTVLSVSPDNTTVVVTDPTRQVVYLVVGNSISTYTGGVGTHAQWSPDSTTVYVTTTGNNLLTHSSFTNWNSTPISPSPDATYNDVAVMVPSIGAYFAGTPDTDGRSYCSTTSIATPGVPPVTTNVVAPLSDSKAVAADRVAATTDGLHILGASVAAGVSDIYVASATSGNSAAEVCTTFNPATHIGTPVTFTTTSNTPISFSTVAVAPTTITGVLPSSNSALAFVTYNGTGGKLPYYTPVTTGAAGTLHSFTLSTAGGTPTAPLAGVFSTDNFTFFVDTAGDNRVHLITLTYPAGTAPTLTDGTQIAPNLPDVTGTTTVTPNLIAQRPKRVTS
jgi:sugar lactone lactonase YvrE